MMFSSQDTMRVYTIIQDIDHGRFILGSIVQKKATQLIFRVFPNQFFKSWNETGSCAGIEKRVSVITVLFNGVKNGGHMLTVFSILCIGAIAEYGNGRPET